MAEGNTPAKLRRLRRQDWNNGKLDIGVLQGWINGKILLDD
jgi:hypothetical protein